MTAINLSIGNSVTLIIAEGDTGVENINAFPAPARSSRRKWSAIVSIGNGLGRAPTPVDGPTASLDITSFNGVGTFELFSGTASFGNNANLDARGNSFNFEGDGGGNLEILQREQLSRTAGPLSSPTSPRTTRSRLARASLLPELTRTPT